MTHSRSPPLHHYPATSLNPFFSEFQPEMIILQPSQWGFCSRSGYSKHQALPWRTGTLWRSPQRPSQHYTHSSSRNSLPQRITREFPAPSPSPSLQLGGKWGIPVVLSPGRTFGEIPGEKEEMVQIAMVGLDPSRYGYKWQKRIPLCEISGCEVVSQHYNYY